MKYIFIFPFVLFMVRAWAQPANNNPCGAIVLPVNTTCVNTPGTNVAATNTPGLPAPGCANYNGQDVFFSFVVPARICCRKFDSWNHDRQWNGTLFCGELRWSVHTN